MFFSFFFSSLFLSSFACKNASCKFWDFFRFVGTLFTETLHKETVLHNPNKFGEQATNEVCRSTLLYKKFGILEMVGNEYTSSLANYLPLKLNRSNGPYADTFSGIFRYNKFVTKRFKFAKAE